MSMVTMIESEQALKEAVKSAIVELLQERQGLVREIVDEIIEDIALSRAIAQGEQTPRVSREEVFDVLENSH